MANYSKLAYTVLAAAAFCGACDDRLEQMDWQGFQGTPSVNMEIKGESLPGQIKLKWENKDPQYDYLQIKYHDPWQNKDVTTLVSAHTDSLVVDKTLKRFGEYTFTFIPYTADGKAGSSKEVKATSGLFPASVSVTTTVVNLTADQLSTNAQEPSEGPIKNLLDGNVNTFFHTRWSSPQIDLPHYIQVNFKETHENFVVHYVNRNGSQVGPAEVQLQISDDGQTWETIQTLSGLPTGSKAEYTSSMIKAGKPFKYFRFNVTKTPGGEKYFNLSEFSFSDAKESVYDPENEKE